MGPLWQDITGDQWFTQQREAIDRESISISWCWHISFLYKTKTISIVSFPFGDISYLYEVLSRFYG